MNIVCLKWGDKFDTKYVNHLYNGFKRNTTLPFNFYCFTDNPKDIHSDVIIKPLPYNQIMGWWHKLYLFSKEIDIEGRILFVDLDTVITGNVDGFLQHDGGFVVLRDLYKERNDPKTHRMGSAIMSFNAHEHSHLWEDFIKTPHKIIKSLRSAGDQQWIEQQIHQTKRSYWQDLFPQQIASYKRDCEKELPPNTRIICFHGKPSIIEAIATKTTVGSKSYGPSPWVKEYWK